MKTIELTQGKVAIVDDADFEFLSRFNWFAQKRRWTETWEPVTYLREGGKRFPRGMAAILINPPPGKLVDHRNRNPLDNQRHNLRLATNSQNMANRATWGNKFGRGVFVNKDNRFTVRVQVCGKRRSVGTFKTPEEAAQAYNEAAKQLHGEFAVINE